MLRLSGIKLSLDEDKSLLKNKIAKKLRIKPEDVQKYTIIRESIDARQKNQIFFVYIVDVELANQEAVLKKLRDSSVSKLPPPMHHHVKTGSKHLAHSPVIIGAGPAGLFAGLLLARAGYRPLLLERGADVDTRTRMVELFWRRGSLDKDCNVQFGEGGAGTFSDGKLTTLIRDPHCHLVIEELVSAGAPPEIAYHYKPHIGTDILKTVVKNIRKKIISLGGQVRFNNRAEDLLIKNNQLVGIAIRTVNGDCVIDTQTAIVAIGHSARDSFAMLNRSGISMTPKPFSMGVRIEHLQSWINQIQYKDMAFHPKLGPAEYKLVYHGSNGHSLYTFCMCPGGMVVAAASEDGGVATNGMSEYARDGSNANSALLVGVYPKQFADGHPLAGIEFQRKWEKLAYAMGGESYRAPAQLVGDFLLGRASHGAEGVEPTYPRGVHYTDLTGCLPDFIVDTLKVGLSEFGRQMKGFDHPGAVLTGVETRSSSPVRIYRDEKMQSNILGIYPAGEGPGYAGGIISSAVDGMKVAEAIIAVYKPLE